MPFWKKTDKGGKKKPPKSAVPRTAQQSIPMQRMFEDGTCRVKPMWGDRIFEKCGIRRDEEGDGGKTLEIRGKRRLSARDGGANYQQS